MQCCVLSAGATKRPTTRRTTAAPHPPAFDIGVPTPLGAPTGRMGGPTRTLNQIMTQSDPNQNDSIELPGRTPVGDTTSDDDEVDACPECDSASIRRRKPGSRGSRPTVDTVWYCRDCTASFDEPVTRERQRGGDVGLSHGAAALAKADPNTPLGGDA